MTTPAFRKWQADEEARLFQAQRDMKRHRALLGLGIAIIIAALLACASLLPSGCAMPMPSTCNQPTCMFCKHSTDRMFTYPTAPASTMPSGTIGISYKVRRP